MTFPDRARKLRFRAAVATLVLSTLLAGCSTDKTNQMTGKAGRGTTEVSGPSAPVASGTTPSHATSTGTTSPETPKPAATTPASAGSLYVSIGDSYAAGYQPTGSDDGATSRNGFAYQVAQQSQGTGKPLTLVNFACSGATSTMLVTTIGCVAGALGPDGMSYPDVTQAAAAINYLTAHRGKVGLVTIIVGGNDVKDCLTSPSAQKCLETAVPVLRRNLVALLKAVDSAVGPGVPVIGLTYPDVFLGLALKGDAVSVALAKESLVLFRSYLNPVLEASYTENGARFIDVTSATGAYGPVTATIDLPPYGTIPQPVAQICTLTFYCQYQDIHPRTAGYQLIADLVTKEVRT